MSVCTDSFFFKNCMLSTNFMNINTERVKILLTIGVCLADVSDLCRTGAVLEKKPGPKIWPVKSEIR
jgi:hypothetical protein